MQRRGLLQQIAALGICGFGAVPVKLWSSESSTPSDATLNTVLEHPLMLAQFMDSKGLAALGRQYLKQSRTTPSEPALRQALINRLGRATADALPPLLDNAVRQDFAAQRTLVLDGWVVSVTEARQCALFALASP